MKPTLSLFLLLLLLGGCSGPTPGSAQRMPAIALHQGDHWVWVASGNGTMLWLNATIGPRLSVLDRSAHLASGVSVLTTLDGLRNLGGGHLHFLTVVDGRTGQAIFSSDDCILTSSCTGSIQVAWGDGTQGALFGATRLAGLNWTAGALRVQDPLADWQRTLHVTQRGSAISLQPETENLQPETENGKSYNFGCNVLDNPVQPDAHTGIPTRCETPEGAWVLRDFKAGSGPTTILSGGQAPAVAAVRPVVSAGLGPPDAAQAPPSQFSLADALAAAGKDAGWSSYVGAHPDAVITSAQLSGNSTACMATICTRTYTWTIGIQADNQPELVATVRHAVSGLPSLSQDQATTAPGSHAAHPISQRTNSLVGVGDALALVNAVTGARPSAFEMYARFRGPQYFADYVLTTSEICLDSACSSKTSNFLVVDGTTGTLLEAVLPAPQLSKIIPMGQASPAPA
jgi:hypothetical protein